MDVSASELHDDFCSKRIGSISGAYESKFIKANCPNPQVVQFNEEVDVFSAVEKGIIDYVLINKYSAESAISQGVNIEFSSPAVYQADVDAFVVKGNDAMIYEINNAIKTLKDNGKLAEIQHYWLDDIQNGGTDKPIRTVPTGQGDPLRINHYNFLPPLSFTTSSGMPSGYCAEVAIAIANVMNRKVDAKIVNYDALIASVITKNTDVAIDVVYPLAARLNLVEFSEPYLTNDIYFVGPKKPNQAGILVTIENALQKNFLDDARYKLVLTGLKNTVIISLFAFVFATIIALVLLTLSMQKKRTVNKLIAMFRKIVDGLPILIILFIIYYIIFSKVRAMPILSAITAFAIVYSVPIFDVFRRGIKSVSSAQIEAARSMGFSTIRIYRLVILPQSLRWSFGQYISKFVTILKYTSIVGLISVIDLTRGIGFIRSQTFDPRSSIILASVIYIVIVLVLTKVFEKIAYKCISPRRSKTRAKEVDA